MDLDKCIPKHKSDREAVEQARLVGFPALNPVLPELLTWLQDANWPVSRSVARLLSTSGPEIVPHVKAVFLSDDGIWKYWILGDLCPYLSQAILAELRPEIERLATHPTAADRVEGVDEAANDLLLSTSASEA